MDISTIDQQYAELRNQAQKSAGEVATLADKLRAAAQSGNQDAPEWMLDLKEIALAIQAEQNQIGTLPQALHAFVVTQGGQPPATPQNQFPAPTSRLSRCPGNSHKRRRRVTRRHPLRLNTVGRYERYTRELHELRSRAGDDDGRGFRDGDGLINSLFSGFRSRRGC